MDGKISDWRSIIPMDPAELRNVARYFAVGGVAAIIDFSLFALFAGYLGYNYLIVGSITFIVATTANYFMSTRFVFQSGTRFRKGHEVALVFMVSSIGLALNQLILWFAVSQFGLNVILGKCIATGVVFSWNYMARSRFVFRIRR